MPAVTASHLDRCVAALDDVVRVFASTVIDDLCALLQCACKWHPTGTDSTTRVADAGPLFVARQFRRPESHPGRPFGQFPQIHVGPINYLPIEL